METEGRRGLRLSARTLMRGIALPAPLLITVLRGSRRVELQRLRVPEAVWAAGLQQVRAERARMAGMRALAEATARTGIATHEDFGAVLPIGWPVEDAERPPCLPGLGHPGVVTARHEPAGPDHAVWRGSTCGSARTTPPSGACRSGGGPHGGRVGARALTLARWRRVLHEGSRNPATAHREA